MTPLERAARAMMADIGQQDFGPSDPAEVWFDPELPPLHVPYIDVNQIDVGAVVRAVLLSIREPSEGMERAGYGNSKGDPDNTGCIDNPDPVAAWQAMIDAALGEG